MKQTQNFVSTAFNIAEYYLVSILCTIREASKFVCSLCKVDSKDARHFMVAFSDWDHAQAVTIASDTTEIKSLTDLCFIVVTRKIAIIEEKCGADVILSKDATIWKIDSQSVFTDKTTYDCSATYNDPTECTIDRKEFNDDMEKAQ